MTGSFVIGYFLSNLLQSKAEWWRLGVPLLLPGEMKMSQIQCKVHFNTFLLCIPHYWCKYWLKTILVVHTAWLVGIGGDFWFLLVFLTIFGDLWWFLLRITSAKWVKEAYNLRNPIKLSHTFSRASAILVRQREIFLVSLCHPRGQLWAKAPRSLQPFSGRK